MLHAPPEFRYKLFRNDLYVGPRSQISPREAYLLWVIRDTEPADGTFDTFSHNFNTMLSRAQPLELPVVIPLDLLALLFGDAYALIRLIAIVASGLIFATAAYLLLWPIIKALVRRHRTKPAPRPLIVGIAFLFVCSVFTSVTDYLLFRGCPNGYPDDIGRAVGAFNRSYAAGEPVITIFGEDSRFAYFVETQQLHLDGAIDLSQREFSATEIETLVSSIDADRVWVLFERGAPYLNRNYGAVIEAISAGDRGLPFVEGPALRFIGNLEGTLTYFSGSELSDDWTILGYDASSEILWRRMPDILCW